MRARIGRQPRREAPRVALVAVEQRHQLGQFGVGAEMRVVAKRRRQRERRLGIAELVHRQVRQPEQRGAVAGALPQHRAPGGFGAGRIGRPAMDAREQRMALPQPRRERERALGRGAGGDRIALGEAGDRQIVLDLGGLGREQLGAAEQPRGQLPLPGVAAGPGGRQDRGEFVAQDNGTPYPDRPTPARA
ncbi:MAG: hypothetical protein WDN44_05280 [Sphingomonas sp.]